MVSGPLKLGQANLHYCFLAFNLNVFNFILLAMWSFRTTATIFGTSANSVDPDQTPQNAASDQGLHRLQTGISIRNRIRMEKVEMDLSS